MSHSPTAYSTEHIQVLSTAEHIRLRPGMYVGTTNEYGLARLFFELFANAIDANLASGGRTVWVNALFPEIEIEDQGLGMPFDVPHGRSGQSVGEFDCLNVHHTKSAHGHSPPVHISPHPGLGLAVVNALSERMQIRSWRAERRWAWTCRKGISQGQPVVTREGDGIGTIISARPDPEIFANCQLSPSHVRRLVFHAAHLFPAMTFGFLNERFHAANGLADLVALMAPEPPHAISPFHFEGVVGDFRLQVAAMGYCQHEDATRWLSWVNGCPTMHHGSHVQALQQAFSTIGWIPCSATVHLLHYAPQYAGPTKGELDLPRIIPVIQQALLEPMTTYLENMNTPKDS